MNLALAGSLAVFAAGAEPAASEEDAKCAIEEAFEEEAAETPAAPDPVDSLSYGAPAARASSNPDMSVILDVSGGASTRALPTTGAHDAARRGFSLRQLEMFLGSNVGPGFRLESQIVFGLFGVEVEEAFGTTLALPGGLQARAGQFLTRFGRINGTHPHSWKFDDQPLAVGRMFGPEGARGVGVELSWLLPLPWFVTATGSAVGAPGIETEAPEDLMATVRLEQFVEPDRDLGLLFGLSYATSPNGTGAGNRTEVYGADLYLRLRPSGDPDRSAHAIQIEAFFRTEQLPGDVVQDAAGYAQYVWSMNPSWETGFRGEWASGDTNRETVQLTYYPSHFSRLRLLGARHDAPALGGVDLSAHVSLELLIGAHGAHAY